MAIHACDLGPLFQDEIDISEPIGPALLKKDAVNLRNVFGNFYLLSHLHPLPTKAPEGNRGLSY
jgi:hypothetical protein